MLGADIMGKLKEYGQEHLLNFYAEIDYDQRIHLLEQIKSIDFELMKKQVDLAAKAAIEKKARIIQKLTR